MKRRELLRLRSKLIAAYNIADKVKLDMIKKQERSHLKNIKIICNGITLDITLIGELLKKEEMCR